MTDTTELLEDEMIDPVTGEIIDQKEPAERLLAQAKEQGVSLVGRGGLLNQLTKNVLETALETELTKSASVLRTRRDADRGEPAQRDQGEDGVDRDRPGADPGPT